MKISCHTSCKTVNRFMYHNRDGAVSLFPCFKCKTRRQTRCKIFVRVHFDKEETLSPKAKKGMVKNKYTGLSMVLMLPFTGRDTPYYAI